MRVCVTGSSGYVGSKLVPLLLEAGHKVTGLDLVHPLVAQEGFHFIRGDIRNRWDIRHALIRCEAVIHLACVSNDPAFDLDQALGKSINYDCFPMILGECARKKIKRFIFASSSAVYGVKQEKDVTEDLPLEPLTDYAKYKAECEKLLHESHGFEWVILRPATVCGYAPSMRLDLAVHILTKQAVLDGEIKVFGGDQFRPNIHIDDICNAYLMLLGMPAEKVDKQTFNCGNENLTIMQTAKKVQKIVGDHVKITVTPTDDRRSYHVRSQKVRDQLGFCCGKSVDEAIREVAAALKDGRIKNPDDDKFYRIRNMKKLGLKP